MRSPATKTRRLNALFSHSDLLLAALLALLALYLSCNVYPAIRFDRERIEVWAFPGQIQVSGLYHYQNSSPLPKSLSLGLPFPVDATHGPPTTFSIFESSEQGTPLREIQPMLHRGDVTFRLWFRPKQEKWVRVDYVQGALVHSGRYILLTTREWGHPLDCGDYILHLAQGLVLAGSSYPLSPDFSLRPNVYSFTRRHFYPASDWEFFWRQQEPATAGGQP